MKQKKYLLPLPHLARYNCKTEHESWDATSPCQLPGIIVKQNINLETLPVSPSPSTLAPVSPSSPPPSSPNRPALWSQWWWWSWSWGWWWCCSPSPPSSSRQDRWPSRKEREEASSIFQNPIRSPMLDISKWLPLLDLALQHVLLVDQILLCTLNVQCSFFPNRFVRSVLLTGRKGTARFARSVWSTGLLLLFPLNLLESALKRSPVERGLPVNPTNSQWPIAGGYAGWRFLHQQPYVSSPCFRDQLFLALITLVCILLSLWDLLGADYLRFCSLGLPFNPTLGMLQ